MDRHVESFAKHLAMEHYLATVYPIDFHEAIAWVEENWPEFVEPASQPWVLAEFIEESERIAEELEVFQALCNIFIGPPPAEDASVADHMAYMEKIDKVFPE